jgi:hypothetical protein
MDYDKSLQSLLKRKQEIEDRIQGLLEELDEERFHLTLIECMIEDYKKA